MSNSTKEPINEQTVLELAIECDLIDSRDIKEEFAQSILAKLREFAALAYAAGQAAEREGQTDCPDEIYLSPGNGCEFVYLKGGVEIGRRRAKPWEVRAFMRMPRGDK